MHSIFATAKGTSVGVSAEALAKARSTLAADEENQLPTSTSSQSSPPCSFNGQVAITDALMRSNKRKFADCAAADEIEDEASEEMTGNKSKRPATNTVDQNLDFSSFFRTAGTDKPISISEKALHEAKKVMAGDENDPSTSTTPIPPSPSYVIPQFTSPAITSTTPLRSAPRSSFDARRRVGQQQTRFNSSFRPPIMTSISSPSTPTPSTPTLSASPFARMCLNSPASSSEDRVISVKELSNSMRKFRLCVMVTERTQTCVSFGVNGENRFSCWLTDVSKDSGGGDYTRLEGEAIGAHAETMEKILEFGKVYDICNGKIFIRRPSKYNERGMILSIDETTKIRELPSPSITVPRPISHLVPLSDVSVDQELDIAGIVRSIFPSSDGTVVDVTLIDQRSIRVLRLSHEYARVKMKPGDIVLVYSCIYKKIDLKDTHLLLIQRGRSKILLNPQSMDPRLCALSKWCQRGQWKVVEEDNGMRTLDEVRRMAVVGESHIVKGFLTNMDVSSNPVVKECTQCHMIVTEDCDTSKKCKCSASDEVTRKLKLKVDLVDSTGILETTIEGRIAEELIGIGVDEAESMIKCNRDGWREICRSALYNPRFFTLSTSIIDSRLHLSIDGIMFIPYPSYITLIDAQINRLQSVLQ